MNEGVENSVDYVNNSSEEPCPSLPLQNALTLSLALILALLYRAVFSLEHFGCYGPGIGVPVFVALYFGAVFLVLGHRAKFSPNAVLLLAVSMVLALFCAGSTLSGLTILNCFLILFTAAGATFLLSGHSRTTLAQAAFLPETVSLSCRALFTRIHRPFQLLSRNKTGHRSAPIFLAALISLPLLAVVLALLTSADAVFNSFFATLGEQLRNASPGRILWALLRTLVPALLIASGLYYIAEPPASPKSRGPQKHHAPLYFLLPTVLLDMIYLLFCAIQIRYLFGGENAAAMAGSWAEYAREGFFQLVAVAMINLSLCLFGSHKEYFCGNSGKMLRWANALLLLLTCIILASAARRMQFYILAYDLSVLRLMTLWAMLAILAGLLAAGWKLFRPNFSFFQIFAPFVLASWCLFCLIGPGRIVANYNVDRYINSAYTQTLDLNYLADLGPAALPALYKLRDIPDIPKDISPAIQTICRDMENSSHWANWKFTFLFRED